MSIQQEWQGLWWRPGDPESRLPGTLHFDAENGLTLKLLGGFSITRAAALPGGVSRHSLTDDPFPILHGELRGQPVTLIGCTAVSTQGGFFGQDIESQTVGSLRAYIGIHLEAPDEPAFVEAAFELEYLLEWSWSGVSTVQARDLPEDVMDVVPLRTARYGPHTIALQHYKLDSVVHRQRVSTRMTAITERTLVTITSDAPQPVHVFDGLIKAVMDLITVAAQAPAGVIGQLTLTAQDGDQPNQRVDVHGKHVHLVKPEDVGDGKYLPFLFTLADVEWQELIPCWMRLHERCRLPISMLTGLFYSPDGYSETRLLSAAAAAEGLHRELYDKPPCPAAEFTDLRRRIKSVIDPTHRPFVFDRLHNQMTFRERLLDLLTIPDADAVRRLIREPGLWASLIRDARNGVAHALNQDRTEDGHALLFHARRVSIGLLSVVLMHEMGLSAEAQRRAAGHPELVWSARQLSDGLAPESDRTS